MPARADAPKRIRVLHVIQNLNYGGMERLLADIVRRVDADRFESHVLVLQYLGRFSEEMRGHATLHQADPQPRYSMLWPRTLVRQIRAIAPDVVHSHSGVWYKASMAARLAGVPSFVHTEHGRQIPDPWQSRLVDGLAARRTTVAVAVSDAVAEHLRRWVVQDRCRIEVVLNGVDTDLHRPRADDGALRAELGIDADAPIIGSIGRLEHIKGYDYMVQAFAHLCRDWSGAPEPVLVVGGDGAERARLESLARELGVQSRVRLLGWRDDIARMHAAFNLFTMSSRSEGTSVSLLEAMSAGLCPVVTDVGGNAAVLGEALRHRLVPPADPAALAEAWRSVLRHPARAEADGEAARRHVQSSYALDSMVRRYEELYARRAGAAVPC